MKHCKTPCTECPFLKTSIPGYLGGFSVSETLDVAKSESKFLCHLTRELDSPQECAGRMLFVSKIGKMFRRAGLEKVRTELKNNTSQETKDKVLSYSEFVKHHENKS